MSGCPVELQIMSDGAAELLMFQGRSAALLGTIAGGHRNFVSVEKEAEFMGRWRYMNEVNECMASYNLIMVVSW
jgi:hypothetical protein